MTRDEAGRRVRSYFLLTFAISWAAAAAVAAPDLLRGHGISRLTAILMFPAMLLGPSVAGITLTCVYRGRAGWRELRARMLRWRAGWWWALLLLPVLLLPAVLALLARFVSPAYGANHYWMGILFGLPAGFLEEIGWTGFAYPAMLEAAGGKRGAAFALAADLGALWVLWHLPVSDFLGAAQPHGAYWLPFYLAFGVAMSAMRVLICWAFRHTESVLLAQALHVSSTGALVVLGAFRVSPGQEALEYAVYGAALWLIVAVVVRLEGAGLRRRRATIQAA